jgi:putative FmdB family regulatory protein
MPIYEYGCRSCGHTLDALQKISDKPLRKCPECGKSALKRLMSAPAFRLKGGGWYETDFKSDSETKRNLADGGAEKPKEETKAKDAGKAEDSAKSGSEKKAATTPASDTKKAKNAPKAAGKSTGSEAA